MDVGGGGALYDSRRCVLLRGCSVWIAGALASTAAAAEEKVVEKKKWGAPTTDDDSQIVYVGAGCFWHVQHEMVLAEKELLGRTRQSFTSIAGYAGGKHVGKDNTVCYHNRSPLIMRLR